MVGYSKFSTNQISENLTHLRPGEPTKTHLRFIILLKLYLKLSNSYIIQDVKHIWEICINRAWILITDTLLSDCSDIL